MLHDVDVEAELPQMLAERSLCVRSRHHLPALARSQHAWHSDHSIVAVPTASPLYALHTDGWAVVPDALTSEQADALKALTLAYIGTRPIQKVRA